MTLEELRQSSRSAILAAAARYGASNVRVFGSVARGDADSRSDLDLLVDLDQGRTLMDLGGFQSELDSHLGLHVDVATERMLRPDARPRILAEAVSL